MLVIDFLKKIFEKELEKKQFPMFAKVTNIYQESNEYWIDCKKLDINLKETNILLTKIIVPKYWGTKDGGIGLIPDLESLVILTFINGDINAPVLSSIIGIDSEIDAKPNEFLIRKNHSSLKLTDKSIEQKIANSKILITENTLEVNAGQGKLTIKNEHENLKDILKEILHQITLIKLNGICSNGGTLPMVSIQFDPSKSIDRMIDNILL